MKILHLTAGNINGGAARGALFLHQALLKKDVESHLFLTEVVQAGYYKNVDYLEKCGINRSYNKKVRALEKYLINNSLVEEKEFLSLGIGAYDNEILSLVDGYDIVHLHWINNQMISMEALSKINKPIVWTFRDMWPFTGGCHYSKSCTRYIKGCGSCPLLKSMNEEDITFQTYNRKYNSYNICEIYPVVIGSWLKDCASKSVLFKDKSISTISNCIDTDTFKRSDKLRTKQSLQIPTDRKIILFGAISSFSDERKGFELLKQALLAIQNKSEYYLVTFGDSNNSKLDDLGFDSKNFGVINNDELLAEIYSAADVFICPSIEEAFGKTTAEAMSCGTPVVAFNSTGAEDIILHKINGYLAENSNVDDLFNGIEWLFNKGLKTIKGLDIRNHICENFSFDHIANQYKDLYVDILENEHNSLNMPVRTNDAVENYWMNFDLFLNEILFLKNQWLIYEKKHLQDIKKRIGNRKVAIYGTGSFGLEVLKILKSEQIHIECFIDSNEIMHGKEIEGLIVQSILNCKNHYIFIASTWYEEIEKSLNEKSIFKEQYITCVK